MSVAPYGAGGEDPDTPAAPSPKIDPFGGPPPVIGASEGSLGTTLTRFAGTPNEETFTIGGSEADPGRYQGFQGAFPEQFDWVARQTQDFYGLPTKSIANTRINYAAQEYLKQYGRYPSASELYGWTTFHRIMQPLINGTYGLEASFGYQHPETGWQYYINDPIYGPAAVDPEANQFMMNLMTGHQAIGITQGFGSNYTPEALQAKLALLSPVKRPTGGSGSGRRGGGGGAGRAPRVFDKAELMEAASRRWRGWMVEEPDNIEPIVDAYMNEANAFWVQQGGSLDFDTYLKGKMRETSRYNLIYGRKAEYQSEEEYIAEKIGAVQPFGLNEHEFQRQVVAGASGGVGSQALAAQTGTTSGATAANQGGFSQRFAQTMRGIAPMMRS